MCLAGNKLHFLRVHASSVLPAEKSHSKQQNILFPFVTSLSIYAIFVFTTRMLNVHERSRKSCKNLTCGKSTQHFYHIVVHNVKNLPENQNPWEWQPRRQAAARSAAFLFTVSQQGCFPCSGKHRPVCHLPALTLGLPWVYTQSPLC